LRWWSRSTCNLRSGQNLLCYWTKPCSCTFSAKVVTQKAGQYGPKLISRDNPSIYFALTKHLRRRSIHVCLVVCSHQACTPCRNDVTPFPPPPTSQL
jgi:hypothetical protein